MTRDLEPQRLAGPDLGPVTPALRAMLEARSVAIVGASSRPGSFGARMLAEVSKSTARPVSYPVNPRYRDIDGRRCYPSLADLPGPVDLVMLGVPDAVVEEQFRLAAMLGCRSAVIFGNAYETPGQAVPADTADTADTAGPADPPPHPGDPGATEPAVRQAAPGGRPALRQRLAAIAMSAGMELCGAGCMGFANVGHGLRAMGYVEPDPLPPGPVALVTHSGSVFSTLLRAHKGFGFTLAVSSGQELVTAAPAYLSYALDQPEARVLALVLEAMRRPDELRAVLAHAAERGLPVVLLTAGQSASGRAMVAAHSGALAGSDAGWEALTRAYGIHRVADLAEMCDTLELFALRTRRRGRRSNHSTQGPNDNVGPLLSLGQQQGSHVAAKRAAQAPRPVDFSRIRGIATVHDSGLERAHAADVADHLGVPFAEISQTTRARLAELLDPGLLPANPLDVWGTGASTREVVAESLMALAEDDAVEAVALAVDLVTELDGDEAYQLAMLDVAERTDKPLAVLANLPSAVDRDAAARLRRAGVAVLEGTRSGMVALGHLLDRLARDQQHAPHGSHPPQTPYKPHQLQTPHRSHQPDQSRTEAAGRLARAMKLLADSDQTGAAQLELLSEYGIPVARAERVADLGAAVAAAARIGYPVVLKTDQPGIAHKSDAHGVVLGLADAASLAAAYADLADRLGPAALVCETIRPGAELALGVVRDPDLGPLIVVGAGGILVELVADRAVALPPLTREQAAGLLDGLKAGRLLAGARGAPPADCDAVTAAIVGVAHLAAELGEYIEALDINPLICGPRGAVAVDALILTRHMPAAGARHSSGSR